LYNPYRQRHKAVATSPFKSFGLKGGGKGGGQGAKPLTFPLAPPFVAKQLKGELAPPKAATEGVHLICTTPFVPYGDISPFVPFG